MCGICHGIVFEHDCFPHLWVKVLKITIKNKSILWLLYHLIIISIIIIQYFTVVVGWDGHGFQFYLFYVRKSEIKCPSQLIKWHLHTACSIKRINMTGKEAANLHIWAPNVWLFMISQILIKWLKRELPITFLSSA